MTRVRGGTALFVLGVLLAQAAWIVAVPPFRGSDEFDHVFRAAGVASGQWRLSDRPDDGRGLLVDVPLELAEAASAQCDSLPYTQPDNCFPVEVTDDGQARIATAAAGYHPAFYWIVGAAGAPLDGAASLYAMRVAAALLCLAGIAAAFVALSSWGVPGGRWVRLGLLTGLTPTVLYTTTVVAPNGLEMVAGLCLWVALLGLGRAPVDVRRERWLLALALAAAPVLIVLRTLGPLWFVAILSVAVLVHGPRVVGAVVRRHPVLVSLALVVCAVGAGSSVWWVRGSNGYSGEEGSDVDSRWQQVLEVPKWILQMTGAFPYRDQPAPLWTYPLVLVVVGLLVVAGLRRSSGWPRLGLSAAVVLTVAMPMLLTWVTLEERGGHWQGRYILPFAIGVLPLAGSLLDRADWAPVEGPRLRTLAWAMLAAAHVGGVVMVVRAELGRTVSTSDPGWVQPPVLLVAALMSAAWLCLGASLMRARDE